jgi:hypothetical protein
VNIPFAQRKNQVPEGEEKYRKRGETKDRGKKGREERRKGMERRRKEGRKE